MILSIEVNHKCANKVESIVCYQKCTHARNWILSLQDVILVKIPVELLASTGRKIFEAP